MNPARIKNYLTIFPLLLFLLSFSASGQEKTIFAGKGRSILDPALHLIVCNEDISDYDTLPPLHSLTIKISGEVYKFSTIPSELEPGVEYEVVSNSQTYRLYFSQLPLINIYTSWEIRDEPKVQANFLLTENTGSDPTETFCGIEYRGGVSQDYPKKSYAIELWEDSSGNHHNKLSLLDMRKDDDWLLLAMYNEPLRLRNPLNHKLWQDIHTPYYKDQEENAKSGIDTRYIELSINDEYMGVYALCERVDRKQLQLKKYDSLIHGELYKGVSWGASTFSGLPPYNNNSRMWGGLEMKYPKQKDTTNWENIYNFVRFVIYASDDDFEENIENRFNPENAVDYFIFLNLLRATDNTGKNIFIARYKENEPYFYVPWDLDGSWGTIWNGERENIYNDILSNGLYKRLLDANKTLFCEKASDRWFQLRNNILTDTALYNRFLRSYNYLLSNGIYKRETMKWGENTTDSSNLSYTFRWLKERTAYLDTYFGNIILNNETVLVTPAPPYRIFPNPVTNSFRILNLTDACSYTIYNLNGVPVKKGTAENGSPIHFATFPRGLYLIMIRPKNEQIITLKFIKQ